MAVFHMHVLLWQHENWLINSQACTGTGLWFVEKHGMKSGSSTYGWENSQHSLGCIGFGSPNIPNSPVKIPFPVQHAPV